jgi:hypothetical protein
LNITDKLQLRDIPDFTAIFGISVNTEAREVITLNQGIAFFV